jgi:hypothetical protein
MTRQRSARRMLVAGLLAVVLTVVVFFALGYAIGKILL